MQGWHLLVEAQPFALRLSPSFLCSPRLQVPIATPGSALPAGLARTPPRAGSAPLEDEHRSPSPTSGIPSPERRQWQVAAQAADRGVDLTARRSRQKRLFRSRSEAPAMLGGAARGAPQPGQDSREGDQEEEGDLEMLRVHSRMALWPQGGSGDGSIV